MDIGVSLPMRSYTRAELEGFARAADEGPFASVSVGERIVYDNHDAMASLAVLAGLTRRVRLGTGVLVLPIHEPTMLAKQCATLDKLSEGRFVLGLGVGPRENDFDATGNDWTSRGRRFEEQLAQLKRIWRGEPARPGCDAIGPTPVQAGGPTIIIGGFVDVALERAGRLADGLRTFDFAPEVTIHHQRIAVVERAWREAGRPGKPWIIASTYFALGPDARAVYEAGMREYYGYEASMREWALSDTSLTSPGAIGDAIKRFRDGGIDEMVFATAHHQGPESWNRLADVVAAANL
jgi:alkanesulfonate monooxygenase SsuD/methylene tetrahydromethanopterin reductase-like flavin-dependent oxidoreductase (luciferase family)